MAILHLPACLSSKVRADEARRGITRDRGDSMPLRVHARLSAARREHFRHASTRDASSGYDELASARADEEADAPHSTATPARMKSKVTRTAAGVTSHCSAAACFHARTTSR